MRWLARAGVVLALLVVLAAVAAWAAPGWLRPRVEAAASHALGRTVTISGLALRPAWPPSVVASGVRVSGLGSVERAVASLAPGSLLRGAPRAEEVRLVRPDVVLDGGGWARPPAAPRGGPPAASAPAAAKPPRPAPPVGRVVIEDGRIAWRDPRSGTRLSATLSGAIVPRPLAFTLALQTPAQAGFPAARIGLRGAAGQATHADLAFGLGGRPVRVEIESAPPERLSPDRSSPDRAWPDRPVPVTITAHAPGVDVQAKGTVAAGRADLAVTARAGAEADIAALFGRAAPVPGPVAIAATVAGDAAHVAVRDLVLSAPQGDLAGSAELVFGSRPALSGTLSSRRLDLDAVLAALAHAPPSPAPAASSAAAPPPARAATVIPDRPLPFAALGRAEADLRLQAASLRLAGVDYNDLAGHLVLHDGHLALDPFAATLPGGARLQASLAADARANPPTAGLVLHVPSIALAPLLAALELPPWGSGQGSLDADLRGTGATPHALAASLAGTLHLKMHDGALEAGPLSTVLASLRLPRLPAGPARVTCLALGADARAGVAALAPLAIEAERLRIDGGGTVDLGQETMALDLRPLLRTGPGLVVPVRVTGPWRKPHTAVGVPGAPAPPDADRAACPPSAATPPGLAMPGRKLPKGIDVLRSLLR